MLRSTFALSISIMLLSLTTSAPYNRKNGELLEKLGMVKIRNPNSPHTKRLAVESRHQTRNDDSHMYVIKLPPNSHYYAHNVPTDVAPGKKIPLGFKSNGKPSKIYHWNLPYLKKLATQKNKIKIHDDDLLDKKNANVWNEVLDKPMSDQVTKGVKQSFYVPYETKKGPLVKTFSSNGKPKGLYVIYRSKKAQYHDFSK